MSNTPTQLPALDSPEKAFDYFFIIIIIIIIIIIV